MPSSAPPSHSSGAGTATEIAHPTLEDGHAMWRMARDSQVLDVNAPYAYLLWCRDFAGTSLVATVGGEPAGFVTGYRRPDEPDTLMVWQVAVDAAHRGQRLASRLLDRLADVVRPQRLETTITPDNEASIGLFTRFAQDRGAGIEQRPVFDAALFPAGHETELLFRIGPLN
ncbi:MAG: diaminobutyrate acetyltransferase [Nocardioidaceae bacterium]